MTVEPAVARKVGEGYDRPNAEQELPIDINYQKLVEWLASRQKLPADWHKRLQAIQTKAAEAVKELPADVFSKLGQGSIDAPLDYFRAVQLRNHLAQGAERTLFGGLTGHAAVWDKIVKAYEKGNVWIGEAAQTMIQNADYEIPYLRKQAAKYNQQITDFERKKAEYVKNAGICANNYQQECKRLAIKGSSVRAELSKLTQELPSHFAGIIEQLKAEPIAQAIQYYRDFTTYAHGAAASEGLMPLLQEVTDGRTQPPAANTTASAAAPAAAAAAAAATDGNASSATGIDVDWVDLGGAAEPLDMAAEPKTIDWDLDLGAATADEGAGAAAISWDIDVAAEASSGPADAGAPVEVSWDIGTADADVTDPAAAAAGFDISSWGIDLTDSGAGGSGAAPAIDWDIDGTEAAADAAQEAGTAADQRHGDSGLDALQAQLGQLAAAAAGSASAAGGAALSPAEAAAQRLEHDAEYRGRLLDDLQELRAFLLQRQSDMASPGNELLAAVVPEAIQAVDRSNVNSMMAQVQAVLALLTAERLRQLLLISSSCRYLDRLVANLQRKAGQESRMLQASKEAQARGNEAKAALTGLTPKISEVLARTRDIKVQVEHALATTFGRPVNVLGEINNILNS